METPEERGGGNAGEDEALRNALAMNQPLGVAALPWGPGKRRDGAREPKTQARAEGPSRRAQAKSNIWYDPSRQYWQSRRLTASLSYDISLSRGLGNYQVNDQAGSGNRVNGNTGCGMD